MKGIITVIISLYISLYIYIYIGRQIFKICACSTWREKSSISSFRNKEHSYSVVRAMVKVS